MATVAKAKHTAYHGAMDLNWASILGLSVGLATDALAVSIAVGLALESVTPRHVFRLSFHFGLFQFMMPIIGWLAGKQLARYIDGFDHWIAFALLCGVGGKMLWEAWEDNETAPDRDPTRGLTLVALSLATSLDALAVGLSMAFLRVSMWWPSVIIGVITAAMCSVGITFSSRIGARFGHWADAAGGIVLIGIGTWMLAGHLGR
ncbi:MAG: manganese efflux pump MntP family protein [Planctomycetaceae bacterium]|nr:manganese efflux pump MntP family protein [Planctomycetaceae bacterium]